MGIDFLAHDTAVANQLRSAIELEGSVTLPAGEVKRVRVPGMAVAACKKAGRDVQPCLLLEVTLDTDPVRFLGREVVFHGLTRIVQSVEEPCPVTGAIIWLETGDEVTILG